ncbi:MAG: hypothetical protein ACTS27_08605, partial [Phycisphaerales bacterium]
MLLGLRARLGLRRRFGRFRVGVSLFRGRLGVDGLLDGHLGRRAALVLTLDALEEFLREAVKICLFAGDALRGVGSAVVFGDARAVEQAGLHLAEQFEFVDGKDGGTFALTSAPTASAASFARPVVEGILSFGVLERADEHGERGDRA